MYLFGHNPKAPAGVRTLAIEDLAHGTEVVIHYPGPKGERTERATVLMVDRRSGRVALRYTSGRTDTMFGGDMGVRPGPHGWERNYTTRA